MNRPRIFALAEGSHRRRRTRHDLKSLLWGIGVLLIASDSGVRAQWLDDSLAHGAPGLPSHTLSAPVPTKTSAPAVDVIEFYNASQDHYFVSSLQPDIDALDSGKFPGWARTGLTFKAYPQATANASPICRFYIPPAYGDSHFFSASPAECAQTAAKFPYLVLESSNAMYIDLPDSVTGACPAGDVPVYRVWDNRADSNHRYTTSLVVRAQMVAKGWVAEGYGPAQVIMCAPPAPKIVSISVCNPTGAGGAGSCPAGSFDTAQIVLAPDGSGNAINTFGAGTTTDEHPSVLPPGSLGSNRDYLFFVAAGTKLNVDIGAVVLSGGAGPDAKGQWTFDFPRADGYGAYGSGYGDVFLAPVAQGRCPIVADGNPAHQDATFDLAYAAPGSVLPDPTGPAGSVLMIYEGVNPCVGDNGGTKIGNGNAYITASVATSRDYGKTWPTYRQSPTFSFVQLPGSNKTQGPNTPTGALGQGVCMGNDCTTTPPSTYGRYPALSPPVSLATAIATGQPLPATMADTEPSAFIDDVNYGTSPFIYLVHGYIPGALSDPPWPDGRNTDLAIARAQLNGGTAPLKFQKWNGQAFGSPGIGGSEAPLLADGAFVNCGGTNQNRSQGSIDYVETTRQYLLLFVCNSAGDPAVGKGGGKFGSAWFYATNDDITNPAGWSAPSEIIGSWSEWDTTNGCPDYKGWYPMLMSLGMPPGHLAATGHAFFMWGCLGGSSTGQPPKRQFSSRMFTISTQ